MIHLSIEKRPAPSPLMRIGAPLIAVGVTLLVGIVLALVLGLDPLILLRVLFVDPLSSANGISEWLLKASPLILIALGLTIGFRANIWNIGAEGMFTIGAIAAALVALRFGEGAAIWVLPAMALAGMLGGMAWAAIPAFLKTKANTSEILVTLMLNYVAALLLSYLINGPMRDPNGFNYPQTANFGPAALLPSLVDGLRVNISILFTLALAGLTWVFLTKSFLGFKMRVGGIAPAAAGYAGFSESQSVWLGLLAGGAASGLAGMMEAAGPLGQLIPVLSPGYGFAAIIVAFIGRLTVPGIVLGGLLLALLYLGGEQAQMTLNLPASLTRSIEGALLFFLLAADGLTQFRVRLRRS